MKSVDQYRKILALLVLFCMMFSTQKLLQVPVLFPILYFCSFPLVSCLIKDIERWEPRKDYRYRLLAVLCPSASVQRHQHRALHLLSLLGIFWLHSMTRSSQSYSGVTEDSAISDVWHIQVGLLGSLDTQFWCAMLVSLYLIYGRCSQLRHPLIDCDVVLMNSLVSTLFEAYLSCP